MAFASEGLPMFSINTLNSSPPIRNAVALWRVTAARCRAASFSISSPAWWPQLSLILFRPSTS